MRVLVNVALTLKLDQELFEAIERRALEEREPRTAVLRRVLRAEFLPQPEAIA